MKYFRYYQEIVVTDAIQEHFGLVTKATLLASRHTFLLIIYCNASNCS